MTPNTCDAELVRDRRTVLRAVGATALGLSTAGCLSDGGADEREGDVVLDPPEDYERLSNAELPFPIYGEALPEVTVPAPLQNRSVTTTEFVGERHVMLTFVFTRCVDVCPTLMSPLVRVQANSISEGFADRMAFLPTTFDIEHDTPEVLADYKETMGVDDEAGNWWFLRPESEQRVEEVVTNNFGVHFQYVDPEEREMEDMAWSHTNLVVLANAGGYIERSYSTKPPNPADVVEDVQTLLERW
jgi:protein SCO1/2